MTQKFAENKSFSFEGSSCIKTLPHRFSGTGATSKLILMRDSRMQRWLSCSLSCACTPVGMLNYPDRESAPGVKTAPAATLRICGDFILILRFEFDLAPSCQLQSPLLSRAANDLEFRSNSKILLPPTWKQGNSA